MIHYSYYENIGYVWKGIKTSHRPKNSTAPGPRPPVLKFLDPPLESDVGINVSGQVPGIWDPQDLGPPELER